MILKIILLIFITFFISQAFKPTNGNAYRINYNFHCYDDYNMICEDYKDSLNFAISLYNNENSLLKNVNFEIFVDNFSDNGIVQDNSVINLNSNFQRFTSKSTYPNYKSMSEMMENDELVDVIMIFDNFKYKQDELNDIEFTLSDMIDDNLIQVLSGLGAYDDGGFYGEIDDTTPKKSFLSKLDLSKANNEFTKNIYKKEMNIFNDDLVTNLFNNEEALSNPIQEKTPYDDVLLSKEDHNQNLTDKYDRIISVGDIHGDYRKLIKVLMAANLINNKKNWIAKNTALVQIGDLIDRGRDSKKILNLMIKLRKQAPSYDSDVFMILGNHETMNIGGRYEYVTASELLTFGNLYIREKQFSYHERYGALIRREMNATMVVGDSLFVHAGLFSYHIENMTLEEINHYFKLVLMDSCTHPSELSEEDMYSKLVFTDDYFSDYGPTWTRSLYNGPEYNICEDVYKTLNITNTSRMIVGHTIQRDGQIHTRCDNHVIFIDVGMSRAYSNTLAYLDIKKEDNGIWARY
eukprot:jgi/Orpsp1_1/1174386/evm.model.c7180000049905.1